jgi:hypothetical protein
MEMVCDRAFRLIALAARALINVLAYCVDVRAEPDCNAVLIDGTTRSSFQSMNYYASTVFAARLSTMTDDQAKTALSTGGTFNYLGYAIGGNFSGDQFKEFKNAVQKSIDVQQVLKYAAQVAVTDGDPTIVNAWLSCVRNYMGLVITMEEIDPTLIKVTLRYQAFPGMSTITVKDSFVEPPNVVVSGQGYLNANSTAIGFDTDQNLILKRDRNQPIFIAINTDRGPASAYLPEHPLPLGHCELLPAYTEHKGIDKNTGDVEKTVCPGMRPGAHALVQYQTRVGITTEVFHSTTPTGANWAFQVTDGPTRFFGTMAPADYSFQEVVTVPANGVIELSLWFPRCWSPSIQDPTCFFEPIPNGSGYSVIVRELPESATK